MRARAENEGALREMLESLRDLPIVGDVRGAGYFQAIELVKDQETKETFDAEESEELLRGFLSGELYKRGLICRTDDRGDPIVQLSPPLIAGPEQFEEIEAILRPVLTEASERVGRRWMREASQSHRGADAAGHGAHGREPDRELGLELASGHNGAGARALGAQHRAADPTPWLRGGELLLTTGIQLRRPEGQRELIERLADHQIAGLGFGTGFTHKRCRRRSWRRRGSARSRCSRFPTSCRSSRSPSAPSHSWSNERYEMLQRSMAGDVLAEALTGHLYPEDLQARLRPFGIGEQVAVLAFALPDPTVAAALVERRSHANAVAGEPVALRAGLLYAVVDADGALAPARARAHAALRAGGAGRRGARRREPRRRRRTRCG